MPRASLPAGLDTERIAVEPPRDPAHGDISTNAAMVLAKAAGMAPRALAELLEGAARAPARGDRGRGRRAGLHQSAARGRVLARAARRDPARRHRLRRLRRWAQGRKVNVEYVSANPTGPLHVGHGRGAVVGDALASLLAKAGFAVCREYYINDAGAQVDALARSLHLRYREALGETIGAIPDGLYPGDYLQGYGASARGARRRAMARRGPKRNGCRRCATSPSPR